MNAGITINFTVESSKQIINNTVVVAVVVVVAAVLIMVLDAVFGFGLNQLLKGV